LPFPLFFLNLRKKKKNGTKESEEMNERRLGIQNTKEKEKEKETEREREVAAACGAF